jgi:hypothetical protein
LWLKWGVLKMTASWNARPASTGLNHQTKWLGLRDTFLDKFTWSRFTTQLWFTKWLWPDTFVPKVNCVLPDLAKVELHQTI